MSSQDVTDPLHWDLMDAIENGTIDDIRRALDNGADPLCESSDGFTPLEKAARGSNEDALIAMFESGVSVDWQDAQGRSLLHFAAEDAIEQSATFLLEHGATVDLADERGNTPLHNTAINDCPEVAQVLLVGGADTTARNHAGKTPLELCKPESDIFPLLYAMRTHDKLKEITDSLAVSRNQASKPA